MESCEGFKTRCLRFSVEGCDCASKKFWRGHFSGSQRGMSKQKKLGPEMNMNPGHA